MRLNDAGIPIALKVRGTLAFEWRIETPPTHIDRDCQEVVRRDRVVDGGHAGGIVGGCNQEGGDEVADG